MDPTGTPCSLRAFSLDGGVYISDPIIAICHNFTSHKTGTQPPCVQLNYSMSRAFVNGFSQNLRHPDADDAADGAILGKDQGVVGRPAVRLGVDGLGHGIGPSVSTAEACGSAELSLRVTPPARGRVFSHLVIERGNRQRSRCGTHHGPASAPRRPASMPPLMLTRWCWAFRSMLFTSVVTLILRRPSSWKAILSPTASASISSFS